jgi:hypothetical protein
VRCVTFTRSVQAVTVASAGMSERLNAMIERKILVGPFVTPT